VVDQGLKREWTRAPGRKDRQKILRKAKRRQAPQERGTPGAADSYTRRALRNAGLPTEPLD
jgi:hypothetical protein